MTRQSRFIEGADPQLHCAGSGDAGDDRSDDDPELMLSWAARQSVSKVAATADLAAHAEQQATDGELSVAHGIRASRTSSNARRHAARSGAVTGRLCGSSLVAGYSWRYSR